MTHPSTMVEAKALSKRYGETQALDDVDLEVATGSILGVLGPNGAGKTTALRILTTLSTPDSGRAWVAGHDVVAEAAAVRRKIGVTGQDATLDELLTGRQNLMMIGELSRLSRSAARRRTERAARAVRAHRRRRPHGQGLLRRHAPAPRPRRQPRDAPAGALPRRADHGARPHQPAAHVGRDPRARRRRRHGPPHDPVPRRGGLPGRRHRRHRPRPGHRARHAARAQVGHRIRSCSR